MLIRRDGLMASPYGKSQDFLRVISTDLWKAGPNMGEQADAKDEAEKKKAEFLAKAQAAGYTPEAAQLALQRLTSSTSQSA
jgi:hypothetical protein